VEHLMTSEEIAELLHVDPVTIRRLVNKSELSAYRIGADYRFAPSDLQDYLQRQRIAARAQNESGTNPNSPLDQFAQMLRKIIQGKQMTPSDLIGRFEDERFNRFTRRVRRVLTLAAEEAQRFQHNYIGTEHLLLGLLREGDGVAAHVLRGMGIEVNQVRHTVEAITGRGDGVVLGEVGLTAEAKKVIALAVDEARLLNHHFVGTEHLLLGLIREGEGIGVDVLKRLGLQLELARAETLRILGTQPQEQTEEAAASVIPPVPSEAKALLAEEEAGLTCTFCTARCPSYFRHCFNCGQLLVHEEPGNSEEK
jgi:excisionase family DNA binding protein